MSERFKGIPDLIERKQVAMSDHGYEEGISCLSMGNLFDGALLFS